MSDPASVGTQPTGPSPSVEQAPSPPEATLSQAKEDEATLAAEIASIAAIQTSLTTLAAGSVDRSRAGATAVVSAATAIATIYAGLLGFVFSVDGTALAARALLAPIFLALSVALSTGYLAYITATRTSSPVGETSGWASAIYERVNQFTAYTKRIVERRIWMLQGAVVALGVGVACIALPFVSPGATVPGPAPSIAPSVSVWPSPPPTSADPALDALLYQAQLDQAVKQAEIEAASLDAGRQDAAAAAALPSWMDSSAFFFFVLLIGLGLVIGIPLGTRMWSHRERPST